MILAIGAYLALSAVAFGWLRGDETLRCTTALLVATVWPLAILLVLFTKIGSKS